jgi:hypothetical protein
MGSGAAPSRLHSAAISGALPGGEPLTEGSDDHMLLLFGT